MLQRMFLMFDYACIGRIWRNDDENDLSLWTVEELTKTCSKTINDDGTYRINNDPRLPKSDLLEKMNNIYDTLKFDE